MSLFPRSAFGSYEPTSSSFTPLFRLLEDFDSYNRGSSDLAHHHHGGLAKMATFNPKFDVKEVQDSYELHGELPGIEQKDVEIEFVDSQTLRISGRTSHSYTSGTPPAGFVEGPTDKPAVASDAHNGHKATVEAVPDESDKPATTEVTKHDGDKKESKEFEPKYWVSERSIGEFSRSFSFPVRVDQDGVHASMKHGVLSIVVPKLKKHESRKIRIS